MVIQICGNNGKEEEEDLTIIDCSMADFRKDAFGILDGGIPIGTEVVLGAGWFTENVAAINFPGQMDYRIMYFFKKTMILS